MYLSPYLGLVKVWDVKSRLGHSVEWCGQEAI